MAISIIIGSILKIISISETLNSEDDNETFRKFLVIEAITAFVIRLVF